MTKLNKTKEIIEARIKKYLLPQKEHEASKRLWKWLAETGNHEKTNWPEWAEKNYDELPLNECLYCQHALELMRTNMVSIKRSNHYHSLDYKPYQYLICDFCSIYYVNAKKLRYKGSFELNLALVCLHGLWADWELSNSKEARKRHAKEIYELHFKLDKYYDTIKIEEVEGLHEKTKYMKKQNTINAKLIELSYNMWLEMRTHALQIPKLNKKVWIL